MAPLGVGHVDELALRSRADLDHGQSTGLDRSADDEAWQERDADAGYGGVALLATAALPWGLGTGLAGLAYGGRWNVGQAMLGDASPETWDRMVRLYKACPKDSTTELCEAVLAVRPIAPDAPAPPGAHPSAPDGAKGPASGTAPGPARGRAGR